MKDLSTKVTAELEPRLSRWLWPVKWILAIPHYILLFFLWIAFLVVSVIAFFAILFTERYPRPLFDLVVGLNRWVLVRHRVRGAHDGRVPALPARPGR